MARPSIAELSNLTDPAEREYAKGKRGLMSDDEIAENIEQFRAIRASDEKGSTEPVDDATAKLVSAEMAPGERDDPQFASFLQQAKELNPDYSDEAIREIYDRSVAQKDQDPISLDTFMEQAKPLNPGYSDDQIKQVWQEQYGSKGALETDPGFSGTLMEGAKQTGRSIKAFGQALIGDTKGAEETAASEAGSPKDPTLVRLLRDINRRKEELGPDASWFDAGSAVGKALLSDPKGAALLLTQQLPNSVAALGSAGVGAAAGSIFGPVGTVVGGLAGLFGANVALETGGKVMEKAGDGFTPDERMDALSEGLKKGAVVSAIDAATFGATKWISGAASRAVERATARTLEAEGVDTADKAAVEAARTNPTIVEKVQTAQKDALEGVNTLGQKMGRGTAEVGMETLGEGAGEYIGELAATGHADKIEAFVEAFSGLGTSLGEIGIANATSGAKKTTELFNKTHEIDQPEIQNILKNDNQTVEQVIGAAGQAIGDGVPVDNEAIDNFLKANDGMVTTGGYTDSHYAADTAIARKVFQSMKENGQRVTMTQDGDMMYRGVSSRVIKPADLPDEPGPGNRVTKGQYEAISVALNAMGKNLIVLDAPLGQFEGVAFRQDAPNTVFLTNRTHHDAVAVAFHEASHLMQGTQLHKAFHDTVVANLRSGWQSAAYRHKTAKSRGIENLQYEVSADIMGDAMTRPEFMQKVFRELGQQVGPQQAAEEAQTFLDKLKAIIQRVQKAVLGHTFKTRDGRDAANAYVKNLEQVHDALAKAVAEEYRKNGLAGVTTQPVNTQEALNDQQRAGEERVIVDPDANNVFKGMVNERDTESIDNVIKTGGPGVIGAVTGKVGNILGKMTRLTGDGAVPTEELKRDIDGAIARLTNPYGFDKEGMENIVGEARRRQTDPVKFANELRTSLAKFGAQFKFKNVYNRPQWLAKQAAVAIGNREWNVAAGYLKTLRKMMDSGTFTQDALHHTTDERNEMTTYVHPVKVKMISVTPTGNIRVKKNWEDQEYHLEEPIGNIPVSTKITGLELARLGYKPDVGDIITREEDKTARKKVEDEAKGKPTQEEKKADTKQEKPEKKDLKKKDVKKKPEVKKEEPTDEKAKQKETKVLTKTDIDTEAQEADPNPTDGQKEAGNYKKGHITINGMEISIENPEGSIRSGTSPDGTPWEVVMKSHYGYIRGTVGKDKDHLDVFVKPGTSESYDGMVYVVDQIDTKTKKFDEHKIVMGAKDLAEAKKLYLENYPKDWQGMGAIAPMTMDAFKSWIKGDTTQPVSYREKKDLKPTPKVKKDLKKTVEKVEAPPVVPVKVETKPVAPKLTAPTETTKTRKEIQEAIYQEEETLMDKGVDVTKLYNPLDPEDTAMFKTRKGYTAMPDNLARLYIERGLTSSVASFSRVIPAVPFAVEPPGFIDRWIRKLQDKNIDIKRMVEAIKFAGGRVPNDLNPVLREEMYQKRAEVRSEDYKNQELLPTIEHMRDKKQTIEEVSKYAHARHVIEDKLNKKLKDMNPTMPNNDALSGMSDAEAQRILNSYVGQRKTDMLDTMAHLDSMIEKTRDMMVDYGLEKQQLIADWRKQYKYYVPLRREAFDEEGNPTGTGRSVRGSSVKDRLGSNLDVSNILANVAQARDQVITRGEKMRPVVAMAGLLMLHPNADIAVLDKPSVIKMTDPTTGLPIDVPGDLANYRVPKIRAFDEKTGEVKWYPDPSYKGHDNVVNFRIKGVDYAIVFNQKNIRAVEMAKAFKDLDTGQLTGLWKVVAPYTRYLASINTQYNPIFGIVNFVRDSQFAMLTLGSTPLQGKQAQVMANAILSLKGIFQDARDSRHGLPPSSATAQLWERFQHVGGPTGYRDLFFTTEDRANEIKRLLEPNNWRQLRSLRDVGRRVEETALFKLLSDYNLMMENAIRLGVFKTAVEMGVDDLQAASYAKNITVNFNKKGQIGAQMGSLYAFFNANVQGTMRIFETMWDKTPDGYRISSYGKKIIAGGLLVGVLQASLLALGGFDDDEPPEFVKQKNFVIPMPGTDKGYGMVPMPLGFNLLPNVGRMAAEMVFRIARGEEPKVFKTGADLFHAVLSTLSPTGGTGSPSAELSPTVVDPILSLEMNQDWTGKKISKEDFSSLKPTPGHLRARDTASFWAMGLSKFINFASGGTDYTPGVYSPTPDAIDYLIQQATGGVGREFTKGAQVVQAANSGEEVPTYKIPLVGRFYGESSGAAAVRDKFYDNIRMVNIAAEEVKGRALHHEEREEFLKDHPEARFEQAAVQVERAIGELRDAKKLAIDRGQPKDVVKMREEQIDGLMKRFNLAVERARKGGEE